jgi:ketosteroid isomerase-like protein
MDQDAVWHTPGHNQLSGDHRCVDAIFGFFAKTMELSGGTFRIDVHDVVANDNHAVALFDARAERADRTYENRNVLVNHIRIGKLAFRPRR